MHRVHAHLFALALTLAPAVPGQGAGNVTVKLQNGQVFTGVIVNEGANFVTLNSGGKDVKILRSIIAEIDGRPVDTAGQQGAPAPTLAVPQTQTAPVSQPAAPQTPADTTTRTVRLKNGTVFRGPILRESAAFVTIAVGGKPVNVLKSLIEELDGAPYGEPATDAGTAAAKPAAGPAPAPAAIPQAAAPPPEPAPAPAALTPPAVSSPAPSAPAPKTPGSTAPKPPAAASPPPAAKAEAKPAARDTTVPAPARPSSTGAVPAADTARQAPAPVAATAAKHEPPGTEWGWTTDTGAVPSAPVPAAPAPDSARTGAHAPKSEGTQAQTAPAPGRRTAPQTAVAEPPLEFAAEVPAELRPVIAQLDDPDPRRQIEAALQLRDAGPKAVSAIPYLIRRFRNTAPVEPSRRERRKHADDSADVALSPARAAAMALVAIGEASVPHLNRALYHNEAAVRAGVCWALGELKHGSSVTPLMETLKDKSDTVRAAVAEAFGKIRDPRTIPLMLTLLSEDESQTVRAAAERALKNLTEIPLLIEGLRDKSALVQDNAAYILWLMTAKEFGKDAGQWETWWREQQAKERDAGRGPAVPVREW